MKNITNLVKAFDKLIYFNTASLMVSSLTIDKKTKITFNTTVYNARLYEDGRMSFSFEKDELSHRFITNFPMFFVESNEKTIEHLKESQRLNQEMLSLLKQRDERLSELSFHSIKKLY